jgi:hypothetical protein
MSKALRKKILQKVETIICDERQDAYGDPEESFERIAKYWSTYLNTPITPLQVSNMMILLKIARTQGQIGKLDNYLDAAGYAVISGFLLIQSEGEV